MSEEKDMRTQVSDLAIENFKKGLNCCECVYDALIRAGVLPVEGTTRAMCIGFGGGVGLTGHTCGALSGAVMANGAVYGRPDPWATPDEERGHEVAGKYYRRYNQMVHDFIRDNQSALCREICAPYGDFHEKARRVNCMKLIGRAAAMAYDYLQMDNETAFDLPYGENLGGNE